MKETKHDYQNCLTGNFYDSKMYGIFSSWEEFKHTHWGFKGVDTTNPNAFDDTYHFVFRYDIHKQEDGNYRLELCMMLQRKGIYSNLDIMNIDQTTLDSEVSEWLKERSKYIKHLWGEVLN